MLAKIFDDILISESHEVLYDIIQRFNSKFQLGTIVHGAGRLCYFCFNILQNDNYCITIDGEDKLEEI